MFLLSIPAEPVSSSKQAERLDNYILGIAKGDKEALAGLYESTHTAVYGFALSLCKNVPDAEDVLQDVFVQIWNAAEQYTPAGKPMAWIFTITRNLALLSLFLLKICRNISKKSRKSPVTTESFWKHF